MSSFTYVLTSEQRLNTEEHPIYYDLKFGGFRNPHSKYTIEVVQMTFDVNIPVVGSYGLIFASLNLDSDDSIFPPSSGITIPITITGFENSFKSPYSKAFSFQCSNLASERILRISILDYALNPVVSDSDYNQAPNEPFDETNAAFALILKITPVIE